MKKPRNYELHQNRKYEGVYEDNLYLSAIKDDMGRSIWIRAEYSIQLRPVNARALAKRLISMADWIEKE